MAGESITVDTRDIEPLTRALAEVAASLGSEANTRLQNAAGQAATQLLAALKQSAASSPTPQARIVAESMTVRRGLSVSLAIGGGLGVGSRGTPAGALVWGSEHGGQNFDAPRGGSYWIAPAVDRYKAGGAEGVYLAAVNEILRDAGVS